MTLAVLVVFPPLIIATLAFRKASARAYSTARDRVAVVNSNLQESLSGVRVAQAMRREQGNIERFRDVASDYLDARVDVGAAPGALLPVRPVHPAHGEGDRARLRVPQPRRTPACSSRSCSSSTCSSRRSSSCHRCSTSGNRRRCRCNASTSCSRRRAAHPKPTRRSSPVGFVATSCSRAFGSRIPNTALEALRGIDLHITPGQVVALVGETGAGKSTIVKLVARFYDPTVGRVLVDGQPLTDIDLAGYRHQLGYVPQEAFLFSGSVRDNIAYGKPDASREEVEAAARAVGAHDFISGLARRLPHRGLRAGPLAVGRAAPAHLPRAGPARRSGRSHPRRGDRQPRPRDRDPWCSARWARSRTGAPRC